jgi:hypothetical protein
MPAAPPLGDDPERQLTLPPGRPARADFAAITDDLDFIKGQLARVPTRKEPGRAARRDEHRPLQ